MQRSNSTYSHNSTPHNTLALEMASESSQQPIFGIVIALILLATAVGILGNILVCLAVTRFRSLRRVGNFYVASLAIADLLVCTAVMPLALYQEFTGGLWLLPGFLCKIWGALDVMLTTSSILHLCAISIDRFHAIRAPIKYTTRRTPKMAIGRIAAVWVVSGFVSGPAFFLIEKENNTCVIHTSKLYAWCSSLISFYIPCAITLFVYFRIYRAARTRARRTIKPVSLQTVSGGTRDNSPSSHGSPFHKERGGEQNNQLSNPGIAAQPPVALPSTGPMTHPGLDRRTAWPLREMLSERTQAQKRISLSHERKAARTIGIVVGAFVICWLPFFIVNCVFRPLCTTSTGHQRIVCEAVPIMYNIFSWFGWCNSSLNPIIYTIFNRDFRQAFKKLLRCRKS